MPDYRNVTLPSDPQQLAQVLGVNPGYANSGTDAVLGAAWVKNAIQLGGDIPLSQTMGAAAALVNAIPGVGTVAGVVIAAASSIAALFGITIRQPTQHLTGEDASPINVLLAGKFHSMFFSRLTPQEKYDIVRANAQYWISTDQFGGVDRDWFGVVGGRNYTTQTISAILQNGPRAGILLEFLNLLFHALVRGEANTTVRDWVNNQNTSTIRDNVAWMNEKIAEALRAVFNNIKYHTNVTTLRGENWTGTPDYLLNPAYAFAQRPEEQQQTGTGSGLLVGLAAVGLIAGLSTK